MFVALLTVTNERGEIRLCNLVVSKAHSQFEFALLKMSESLRTYGHPQPSVFYTDNMADKGFLERCFSSLRENVTPVEKYSHLPRLIIPLDTITVHHPLKTVTEIDEAMRSILQSIPEEDEDLSLVIGLDAEYNVEISAQGHVTGRGQTAILQIAFGKNVFILQVS